jgi:Alginate lyase
MIPLARVLFIIAVLALPAADGPPILLLDAARVADLHTRFHVDVADTKPVIDTLIRDADKALAMKPVSVMDKGVTPPSGDKHDYMSQAPYFWPDPTKPDGRPYIRKDGQRNPEINKIVDHENIFKLTGAVSTLGLAYAVTGREDYAAKAATLVRVWFLDPATKMNPHLRFGQGIPGINDGRGIGIIETRSLPELLDGVTLLKGSKAWTAADQAGLEAWMRDYVRWLVESPFGRDESKNGNNHETWYEAQVTALALWTGQTDLAKRTLERGRESLAKEIEPDGKMPRELARTNPWQYSAFNLEAFFTLATLGTKVGIDLWNYRTADGRSLHQAVDFLVPFAAGDQKWPYEQLHEFHPSQLQTVLRHARVAWRDPKYRELAMKIGGSTDRLDLLVP